MSLPSSFVLDSSCWLDFLSDSQFSSVVQPYLGNLYRVIVPTLVLYEVYKKVKKEVGEERALTVASLMKQGVLVPLDEEIALQAADLSLEFRLPMADAIVYATALHKKVPLVSSDFDHKPLRGVIFLPKSHLE